MERQPTCQLVQVTLDALRLKRETWGVSAPHVFLHNLQIIHRNSTGFSGFILETFDQIVYNGKVICPIWAMNYNCKQREEMIK